MDTTLLLLLLPLVIVDLTMRVVALVSLARRPRVRGPKLVWVLIILCVSFFGWAGYFLFGRQES